MHLHRCLQRRLPVDVLRRLRKWIGSLGGDRLRRAAVPAQRRAQNCSRIPRAPGSHSGDPQRGCPFTCPWTGTYGITTVGSFDAGATVNDILVTTTHLYVATANGLRQYDLLNQSNPTLTSAVFQTSGANVSSLSLAGDFLYAADGDNSVEVFDVTIPSIPQKAGSLQSLPRSTAVHATTTRIYVSDGQNTDVFVGSGTTATKAATVPIGSTAFAAWSGDTIFAAGTDRRVRALDWTNAGTPVEVFSADVLPTGGSVNRAAALTIQGGALYVAAGDAGLHA